MSVAAMRPFKGSPAKDIDIIGHDAEPGLVVDSSRIKTVHVRKTGQDPLPRARPPQRDDYVFLEPTRINPLAMVAWAAVPNMQYFWLVDAVSQNQPVPWTHLLLIAGYAVGQIGAFLCLGILLFQKRDVG